jgi:hypothetical protein
MAYLNKCKDDGNRPKQKAKETEGPCSVPETAPVLNPNKVNPKACKNDCDDRAYNEKDITEFLSHRVPGHGTLSADAPYAKLSHFQTQDQPAGNGHSG